MNFERISIRGVVLDVLSVVCPWYARVRAHFALASSKNKLAASSSGPGATYNIGQMQFILSNVCFVSSCTGSWKCFLLDTCLQLSSWHKFVDARTVETRKAFKPSSWWIVANWNSWPMRRYIHEYTHAYGAPKKLSDWSDVKATWLAAECPAVCLDSNCILSKWENEGKSKRCRATLWRTPRETDLFPWILGTPASGSMLGCNGIVRSRRKRAADAWFRL